MSEPQAPAPAESSPPPPEVESPAPPTWQVGLSLTLAAVGWLFVGMAIWILLLAPAGAVPAWPGWRLRDALLTVAAACCLRELASMLWSLLAEQHKARTWEEPPALTQNLGAVAWQMVMCLFAASAFGLAPYGLGWEALGLNAATPGWLAWAALFGLASGPGFFLPALLWVRWSGEPLLLRSPQIDYLIPDGSSTSRPWAAVIGMLLVSVVLGPFAEELLFRGVVYPGLRSSMPVWAAVAVNGLLFGLFHRGGGWTLVATTSVAGALFALLTELSGSVWPAIVAHVLLNSKLIAIWAWRVRGAGPR